MEKGWDLPHKKKGRTHRRYPELLATQRKGEDRCQRSAV